MFPSATQFATQLDDYRNGGQGISGQLAEAGSSDEFPPLGRDGVSQQQQQEQQQQQQQIQDLNQGQSNAQQQQQAGNGIVGDTQNG